VENIFSCVLPDDFWIGQAVKVALPFILLLLLVIIASIVYLFQRCCQAAVLQKRLDANPFERVLSLYLSTLVGVYIYFMTTALSPFRCLQQADGTFTMVASPNLDCFDDVWSKNLVTISFGLLNTIAIPVSLVFILWKFRNEIESNRFQWRFGLLTSRYKPEYYWWSTYLLTKKTLLVMLVDLTNGYSVHFRAFLVLLALISALVIESLCKPRRFEVGVAKVVNLG
jgi:hypothetical protein